MTCHDTPDTKMLLGNKSSASSNKWVTRLALTKERISQHLQTGEVHYQQYTNKNEYEQAALLSNTKLTEYPIQLVFIRDFAGDLAEIVQAAADVEGEEVAGVKPLNKSAFKLNF